MRISSSFSNVQKAVKKHRLNIDVCLVLHSIGVFEVIAECVEFLGVDEREPIMEIFGLLVISLPLTTRQTNSR